MTSREEVIDVSLKQIKQATAPQLKAFIHVRKYDTYARPVGSEKWPNKGSLEDAEADPPVNCLLTQANNVKELPIKLMARSQQRTTNANEIDSPDETSQVHHQADVWTVYTNTHDEFGIASDILKSDNFLSDINLCFNSTGNISVATEINSEMANLADTLQARLIARLAVHVQQRLPPTKHNHWCLLWFKKNIPIVSATMVVLNHVKFDLTCLGGNDCLLSIQNNFRFASNSEGDLEGCYLYFDRNQSVWVRSGKVTGRSFTTRHDEHKKASKNEHESQFYAWFPSNDGSGLTSNIERRGWFENLDQNVAVGIDRTVDGVMRLLTADRDTEQGFLRFENEFKNKIEKVSFNGARNIQDKQMHMVAYLFELAYDIALGSTNNASTSPGFETPMGVFGGASGS